MINEFHVMIDHDTLELLSKSSAASWNNWRKSNEFSPLDLSNANLSNRFLNEFDFSYCNLINTSFKNSELKKAAFKNSDISYAEFSESNLSDAYFLDTLSLRTQFNYSLFRNTKFQNFDAISADFTGSKLHNVSIDSSKIDFCIFEAAIFENTTISKTSLMVSSFYKTDLSYSKFLDCRFKGSLFIKTNVEQSTFENCNIFGISCWKISGTPRLTKNLNISDYKEPPITLDNLENAQFLYLLLSNSRIPSVIDSLTTKIVLILGRFSDQQNSILDLIRYKIAGIWIYPSNI